MDLPLQQYLSYSYSLPPTSTPLYYSSHLSKYSTITKYSSTTNSHPNHSSITVTVTVTVTITITSLLSVPTNKHFLPSSNQSTLPILS